MYLKLPIVTATLVAFVLHACTPPPPPADTTLPEATATDNAQRLVDRLVGEWIDAPAEDSTVFHEKWRRGPGRDLEGIGYVMLGNDTISIEHLRILHTDTGTFYSAEIPSQNNSGPVLFRLTAATDSLVFENPLHDFPTRIVYRPEGEGWLANVSGQMRGESRSLQFHLMPREEGPDGVR